MRTNIINSYIFAVGFDPVLYDPTVNTTQWAYSEGNIRATRTAANSNNHAVAEFTRARQAEGKWYLEMEIVNYAGAAGIFGLAKTSMGVTTGLGDINSWASLNDGRRAHAGSFTAWGGTTTSWATGKTLQIAVDLGAGNIWFGGENVWPQSGDPATGANPAFTNVNGLVGYRVQGFNSGHSFRLHTTPDACKYAPPSGFSFWGQT